MPRIAPGDFGARQRCPPSRRRLPGSRLEQLGGEGLIGGVQIRRVWVAALESRRRAPQSSQRRLVLDVPEVPPHGAAQTAPNVGGAAHWAGAGGVP